MMPIITFELRRPILALSLLESNELLKMRVLFLTGFLVQLFGGAFSFSPSINAAFLSRTLPSISRGRKLFSATPTTQEDAKVQAIESLEKLRDRQMEELRETERLLKRFNTSSSEDVVEYDDAVRSLSTAASIMSGFDYGFKSRSEGASFSELKGGSPAFEGYGPPANILRLGTQQFVRNLNAMRGEYAEETDMELTSKQVELHEKLEQLTLNSTAIWEREYAHGPIEAPYIIKIPYLGLCALLDVAFEGRYVPSRFFLLETVARMPYFSYIAMLHLYETLGFWRRSADMKRIHFAEELNEFRHLLIMESLGGDQRWWIRFLAQHSAIAYYVGLCFLWAISPTLSYRFSELLETHAVNTYGQFLDENEEMLKEMPPSLSAVEYYSFGSSDPFYAEFQTSAMANGHDIRRPGENMKSLYDVFKAIQADETDHVGTMHACLDPNASLRSPSIEKRILFGVAMVASVGFLLSSGEGAETTRLDEIFNGADIAGDSAMGDGIAEAVAAAVAGLTKLGTDLMESSGGGEGAEKGLAQLIEEIVEFFL